MVIWHVMRERELQTGGMETGINLHLIFLKEDI